MAFSSSPYRHESDGRSSSSVDTSDIEADFLDESSPVKFNAADRSQDAATLGVLGALNDSYQCSLRTPDIKAGPCAANIESHTLTRHPDRQLPYQQAYSSSLPRKRKYKVTTMAGSPLKLRISRSDGKSFGLADSGDKPSPWDALAGENSPSSRGEPLPDRRAVPSWQQAAFSARAAFMQPPGSQAHPYMLRDGDQLYEVSDLSLPPVTTKATATCRSQLAHSSLLQTKS